MNDEKFSLPEKMIRTNFMPFEPMLSSNFVDSCISEMKPYIKEANITVELHDDTFKFAGVLPGLITKSNAETGASLDDTFKIATEANDNIRTLGVALSPCILPEAGKPTFEINNDEIEIGMGIHGEPGIKREKLRPANDLVDDLYKRIMTDSKLKANDNIAVMINSLGATPLEELYIISKRVNENLSNSKIKNIKTYVGRYATSMEMAGMSITTLKLSDNLKKNLLATSECPFWNN